ncbi:hypothetical protein SLI_2620 [Streptomyces lividans 1326]|uniref:Uncharacterized protein n=1 Tax=Streptomyces lividans 1326 TaxID=1200984 RepID=A0A7U9HAI7_STRLI|nr:hypothetical protein SLI_2620 [Streptomyces lividans 1326]
MHHSIRVDTRHPESTHRACRKEEAALPKISKPRSLDSRSADPHPLALLRGGRIRVRDIMQLTYGRCWGASST